MPTIPHAFSFPRSTRYQRDERTWKSRLADFHQNWNPLIEGVADAYLRWKYGDPVDTVTGCLSPAVSVHDITGNLDDPPANSSPRPATDGTTLPPAPNSDDQTTPLTDIEVSVIDIYTLSTSVKLSRVDDKTTAVALAGLGFIGNTPFRPSVAISMKTLELYRILRRRKASFSVEGFVKVICDLYTVGYPRFVLCTRSFSRLDPLLS